MSNAGHVSGKVVVVTGGAHGMGAAHVRALAREGAIVAATDIIDDLGASLAEQLQSEGRDVSYYHHDVTSRAGWEAVVASVQQAHGAIDVLVNNVGVQVRSMGIEADDREWDLWERGGRHESVFGQRAESGRGHVGVRAILQVVNQVQQ